jgi:DNA polymerase-3 subunit epsilon
MIWGDTFTTFDTETTGFGPKARIIEVAAVTFEKGHVVREWSTFLDPEGVDWDSESVQKALSINKITRAQLVGAPKFKDVIADLLIELSHPIWAAHNAEFDVNMLAQERALLNDPTLPPSMSDICFDTMSLSSQIHPAERTHKLADTAARWGVVPDGAHRAASDAITCGRILWKMIEAGKIPALRAEAEEFQKTASQSWKSRRRY